MLRAVLLTRRLGARGVRCGQWRSLAHPLNESIVVPPRSTTSVTRARSASTRSGGRGYGQLRFVIIVGAAVALLVIVAAVWGWEAIQPRPDVVTPLAPSTVTSPAPSTVTSPAPSTIVLDYDTGDTSQFNLTQLVGTWSLTFDAGRTRRGSGFSGRFEVRAGDNPLSASEMTERAEVGYGSFGEGDDIWIGWSTWFDSRLLNPTDTTATDVTNTFTQFH